MAAGSRGKTRQRDARRSPAGARAAVKDQGRKPRHAKREEKRPDGRRGEWTDVVRGCRESRKALEGTGGEDWRREPRWRELAEGTGRVNSAERTRWKGDPEGTGGENLAEDWRRNRRWELSGENQDSDGSPSRTGRASSGRSDSEDDDSRRGSPTWSQTEPVTHSSPEPVLTPAPNRTNTPTHCAPTANSPCLNAELTVFERGTRGAGGRGHGRRCDEAHYRTQGNKQRKRNHKGVPGAEPRRPGPGARPRKKKRKSPVCAIRRQGPSTL